MMKYDLFISYSRADIDAVTRIVNDIHTQTNAKCWIDWKGIESGDEFVDVIISAIDSVDTVVFMLSANAMDSYFVKKEIEYARNTGKKIIPVVIDGGKLRGWFLFQFGNVDYTDISKPLEYNKLLDNLKKWYGTFTSVPSPTPKTTPTLASAKTYKVGDYFNESGKKGVVFQVWDGGRHGKIISLDETRAPWDSRSKWDSANGYSGTRTYADSESDGKANTDKIMARSDREYFEAFKWCRAKGSSWYLPAKDELKQIYNNKDKLNSTLSQYGTLLSNYWYWSSTEYVDDKPEFCAWYIAMSSGRTDGYYKYCNGYVRAVSAF